ncbi:hypothetical protein [Streptomyces sp. SPB074]|uniref:hypothetical protein n=1 Tax=Streptomyces sp. (strain SPB074) TaxID=465543 RepID=UPI001F463754
MHKSAMLRYFETREDVFLEPAADGWTTWSAEARSALGALATSGGQAPGRAPARGDGRSTRRPNAAWPPPSRTRSSHGPCSATSSRTPRSTWSATSPSTGYASPRSARSPR